MLSVIMLGVIMLNAIMMSVVAPLKNGSALTFLLECCGCIQTLDLRMSSRVFDHCASAAGLSKELFVKMSREQMLRRHQDRYHTGQGCHFLFKFKTNTSLFV
jgi:hypothetical protein